jgi:hypothetical protein
MQAAGDLSSAWTLGRPACRQGDPQRQGRVEFVADDDARLVPGDPPGSDRAFMLAA